MTEVGKLDASGTLADVLDKLATAVNSVSGRPRMQGRSTSPYAHLEKLKTQGTVSDEALTILERAEYELGVIMAMVFQTISLIVADFINWAKDQGIAVGPGAVRVQARLFATPLASPTSNHFATVSCSSDF